IPDYLVISMSAYIDASQTASITDNEEVDHVDLQDDAQVTTADGSTIDNSSGSQPTISKSEALISIAVLCCINLLNYMDRFTVAAVLDRIEKDYKIDNSEAGLLQTSFIVSYMLLSPLFGYLGDRGSPGSLWSRKTIMIGGVLAWSAVTLASSFVPKNQFGLFLLTRCLVGIGEASYITVSTPIVADLFVGDARTVALIVFNLQVPLGSGLGYVVGGQVAQAADSWRSALRVTPGLGVVCVLLLLLQFREPACGQAEKSTHMHATSWRDDVRHLLRNRSFMLNTLGFTAVAFVAGALTWWTPLMLDLDLQLRGGPVKPDQAALGFGIVTCVAGIAGVALGSEIARRLRHRMPNIDPIVNGAGLLLAGPFLWATLYLVPVSVYLTLVLMFATELLLCLNWALVNEITLRVTVPTRRSMATSINILASHLLGDAGSPYLVGLASDLIAKNSASVAVKFSALQLAMYCCCFVSVLGGGAFLACSLTYLADCERVIRIEREANRYYRTEGEAYTPPASLQASSCDGDQQQHDNNDNNGGLVVNWDANAIA
ncbi:hypothetical protein BOX15_Mlig000042g1, partial [Macrostomum lignano]